MAYVATKNGPKYLCNSQYKSFKYFTFPSTNLTYADIPTIKNKNGEDIINLAAFYADFKTFVYDIADNALKRILKDDLQDKLTKFDIINHFKPKVYEPFYNSTTNTLSILLKCSPEI